MPMYSSGGGGGVKRKVGIIGKQTGDTRKFRSSPGPAKTYKPVKDGLKAMNPGSVDPRMRRLIGRSGPPSNEFVPGPKRRKEPDVKFGVPGGRLPDLPYQPQPVRPGRPARPGLGPIRTLPVGDVKTGPVKRRTARRRTARAL